MTGGASVSGIRQVRGIKYLRAARFANLLLPRASSSADGVSGEDFARIVLGVEPEKAGQSLVHCCVRDASDGAHQFGRRNPRGIYVTASNILDISGAQPTRPGENTHTTFM
jgi:hypothetical protein